MKEIASEVVQYFQENLPVAAVVALITGFLASKTVAHGGKENIAVYFFVGVLGSFLGQFAIRYFGIKEILDQVAGMWLLFDFLAAYFGSFVVAAVVHFLKPT